VKSTEVNYYNNFNEIENKIWQMLNEGASNRNAPFHLPVFVCGDHDARIVVLRKVEKDKSLLQFHSDIRSNKVNTIKKNPHASLLFYDKDEKIQIRVKSSCKINYKNEVAKIAWENTSHMSRKCYLADNGPGTISKDPTSGLNPKIERMEYSKKDSESGFKNFCVIQCFVESIEWLYLAAKGHRRLLIDLKNIKKKYLWLTP
tara:strand:- start:1317 stop:1922 length:606 start_codon:yes stop_codon:yes gene_type:complete